MMLCKLFTLTIIFAMVASDFTTKTSPTSHNIEQRSVHVQELASSRMILHSDLPTLILDVVCAIIGYKITAITVAVKLIGWIVSNVHTILVAAASVIGICKFTNKCNMIVEQIVPVEELQGLATPENLQTAETFLRAALEKYAEDSN